MRQAPARSALRLLLALFAAACPLPALHAQRTIHVPADAPSIQAGIDTAATGDTVLVAPGTYLENIDFKGKAITVTSSDGPATTILDGQAKRATVAFRSQEDYRSILSGFTVQNGGQNADADAGDPNTFEHASPTGGVFIESSSPSVTDNRILANQCSGVLVVGYGLPAIQRNLISGTLAPPNASVINIYCLFGTGSAIALRRLTALQDPTPFSVTMIDGNTIENNTQSNIAPVFISYSTVQMTNNIIRNNSFDRAMIFTSGSAIVSSINAPSFIFENNLVYNNRCNGPTISVLAPNYGLGSKTGSIVNNTITSNTSSQGVYPPPFAQLNLDGELSGVVVANNIVVGTQNQTAVACNLYEGPSTTPASFDHNDIWNSDVTPATLGNCLDAPGSYGNISQDPLFSNPTSSDFHLTSASPAVDTGNNSASNEYLDLEGNARVLNATGKSQAIVDLGAYELRLPGSTIPPVLTRTVLTPSPYRVAAGSTVSLHATVSLNKVNAGASEKATGNVQFLLDGVSFGSAVLTPAAAAHDAECTLQTPPLSGGLHIVDAAYDGQGSYPPSFAIRTYILVDGPALAPASIALASSQNPSRIGTAVTFTATVSGASSTPTGTVTFAIDGASTTTGPLTAGVATFTTSSLPRGPHNISATYSGDANFATSTASLLQTVQGQPSTTTLTASALSVPANTPITLTATTTIQGGTAPDLTRLQITDENGQIVPLTPTSANTVTTAKTFTPGTHTVTATFAGDTTAEPSTSLPLTITVAPYPTTVTLAFTPSPALAYVPILATATVSFATPSAALPGIVTFTTGGRTLGSATVLVGSPNALLQLSLPAGTYPITATYTGSNPAAASATTTATLVVQKAPVVLAFLPPLPPAIPQSKSATFNASFHDTSTTATLFATGPIVPTIDGVAQPALPLATALTYTVSGLAPGTHLIALTYPGDANFLPSTTAVIPLVILNRDFSISGGPTLTVPAQHYRSLPLTLASIGDFAGPVTLACADLPVIATCRFSQSTGTQATGTQTLSSQATITLAAGSTAPVTLTVETSALPFYMSSDSRHLSPLLAAFLAPLLLFVRRNRTGLRLLTLALAATLVTLSGCGGKDPAFTPPGTYTIHVVGQSTDALPTSANLLHSQAITLVVTP